MCGEAIKDVCGVHIDIFISDINLMRNLYRHLKIKFFNSTFLIISHIHHIP